jgi:hypothetical protein
MNSSMRATSQPGVVRGKLNTTLSETFSPYLGVLFGASHDLVFGVSVPFPTLYMQ